MITTRKGFAWNQVGNATIVIAILVIVILGSSDKIRGLLGFGNEEFQKATNNYDGDDYNDKFDKNPCMPGGATIIDTNDKIVYLKVGPVYETNGNKHCVEGGGNQLPSPYTDAYVTMSIKNDAEHFGQEVCVITHDQCDALIQNYHESEKS